MNPSISNLRNRFPARSELLPVLAFIAFLVFGRMLFIFVWKLPSWLLYLTVGEILSNLSYSLVFSLLESAGYTLLLALIGFILPLGWFRDCFVARSAWAMTIWLGSLAIYFNRLSHTGMGDELTNLNNLYPWLTVTFVLVAVVAFFSGRVGRMRAAATWFADQTLIFLFLLIPASLVGFVVVVIRNLS